MKNETNEKTGRGKGKMCSENYDNGSEVMVYRRAVKMAKTADNKVNDKPHQQNIEAFIAQVRNEHERNEGSELNTGKLSSSSDKMMDTSDESDNPQFLNFIAGPNMNPGRSDDLEYGMELPPLPHRTLEEHAGDII